MISIGVGRDPEGATCDGFASIQGHVKSGEAIMQALIREAKNKLGSVKVYQSDFRPMKNVLAGRNERSLFSQLRNSESK